jgi:MscS family membrane protein
MEQFMEKLEDFWSLVVDVWHQGFMGVDIGHLLVALAIFVGFLILRRAFTRLVVARIKRWSDKTSTPVDNRIITALENPIRFIPVVMGAFFAIEYLDLSGLIETIAANLVRSLVVFTIFWGFYNAVDPLSGLLGRLEKVFSRALVEWLVKAIKVGVVFIGGATILEIWGIKVGPLIAGLGLFGVAVALGAQDLFKNLIAGILIIAEKRFGDGDWIRVDGVVEARSRASAFARRGSGGSTRRRSRSPTRSSPTGR